MCHDVPNGSRSDSTATITDRSRGRAVSALLLGLALTSVSGCRGYIVGSAYSTDIRTVSVPIFKSDSFRRGVEF